MTDIEEYLDRLRLRGGLDKMGRALPNSVTGGSRWRHYLRCDECGVDAGKACREMDQSEALVVCDGRRLHVGDSADRLEADRRRERAQGRYSRRDLPADTRPQAKSRRARGLLDDPTTAPCQYCGVQTRLWGGAVAEGKTWCSEPECRRDRKRQRARRHNAARPSRARPQRPCAYCQTTLVEAPPRVTPVCGPCQPRHSAAQAHRARHCTPHVWIPCHWCQTPVPQMGRRRGSTPCCSDLICRKAQNRELCQRYRDQKRRQEATDPAQQPNA